MTQEAITSYDAMGREVSSTDRNTGEVTRITYDFMGRAVETERSLTDQEGKDIVQTETKSYNANGSVTSETSSAGVTTEYHYDNRNRVTIAKEDADDATKTTETSYGYETAVIHTLAGTKTYKDLQVQTTKVNGTVTDKTWTDHAGNAVRTLSSGIYTDHVFTEDGKEIAAVTLGSSTDGEGKISLTLYNKEGKTTHTISQPVIDGESITTGKDSIINETAYDVNGNESAVTDGNGNVTTYTYDAENRLSKVSVTDKDGKTAVIQQNRYNGDGQRIQKVEGSKTTNYYYQDGVVSYTTDGENSQTSQNLIGTDGNILATQRYGSDHTDYLLYHKDIQGSSTSLVKEDGSADATYQYTDFGETTINGDNKVENEVCYTGGIYDQSTGLYYLNARYYNPEDGRFVTEDTYRGENDKPDTQHLYVYCANNPINHVDPSGHYAVALYTLVKVVAGGVVFYVSYSTWKRRRIKTRYAGRRVTFKTRISIWLTWRAANRIMHSKGKGKKKKQSKMSEKEKSSDTPSWADGHNPKAGENGNAYAKREMEKEDKDMNIVN